MFDEKHRFWGTWVLAICFHVGWYRIVSKCHLLKSDRSLPYRRAELVNWMISHHIAVFEHSYCVVVCDSQSCPYRAWGLVKQRTFYRRWNIGQQVGAIGTTDTDQLSTGISARMWPSPHNRNLKNICVYMSLANRVPPYPQNSFKRGRHGSPRAHTLSTPSYGLYGAFETLFHKYQ